MNKLSQTERFWFIYIFISFSNDCSGYEYWLGIERYFIADVVLTLGSLCICSRAQITITRDFVS